MADAAKIVVRDEAVLGAFQEAPRVLNSEFNRSFSRLGGAFYRRFARERLRRGGIQVRRKIARGGTGGISIPARARALGFRGFLLGRENLNGKAALLRNTNPVAYAHEVGATITPRRGKYLFLRVKNLSAARKAGVRIRRGEKPAVIRVRRVRIEARLGFFATWRAFLPEARIRVFRSLQEGVRRAVERGRRRAQRKGR